MSFESMIDWRSPPITKRAKQSISYDDQSISYDDCFGFDLKEQPSTFADKESISYDDCFGFDLKEQPSTFADKVYLSDNNEGSDVSIPDEIDVINASVLDKGEGSVASGSDSETVQDYQSFQQPAASTDDNLELIDNNEVGTDDDVELADVADDDSVELSSDATAFYTDAIDKIQNDAASKMFVKCSPPSHTDKEFSAEEFETHMSDNVELMRAALSSYSPDPPPIQTYHELVQFFKKRQAYHTNSLSRELIKTHFFDTFNKDHFRYHQNAEGTSYRLTLIPTDKLYTGNTVLHKAMTETLELLTSLIKGAGAFNKVNSYFNADKMTSIQSKDKLGPVEMILKWFKAAWDLQADGDQTNATLCPASTKALTDHLIKENILEEGQQICDLGSSYGSLLLNMVNYASIAITGYGIEESRKRHVLGSFCFARCIRMCERMDYSPLKSFAVQLVCDDLVRMTKLPPTVDHALAFNKAFPPDLCIACALLCLNSPTVKTYTDVKASFHSMNLKQSTVQFSYKALMKHLGFSVIKIIDGLKMNGTTSEAAGTFVTYRVTYQRIDAEFLKKLYLDFFRPLHITWLQFEPIFKQWEIASTTQKEVKRHVECSKQYPTFPGPVISLDSDKLKDLLAYLDQESNTDNFDQMLDRREKLKAIEELKNIQTTCIGGGMICANEGCDDCRLNFPSEETVKEKFCEVNKCLRGLGNGLFAKHKILEGTYICQYGGKISNDKPDGDYVAKLLHGKFIDAARSKCVARYANHSCKPNAKMQMVMREVRRKEIRKRKVEYIGEDINSVDELWIMALEDIKEGDEITFDYGSESTKFFDECLCKECSQKHGLGQGFCVSSNSDNTKKGKRKIRMIYKKGKKKKTRTRILS